MLIACLASPSRNIHMTLLNQPVSTMFQSDWARQIRIRYETFLVATLNVAAPAAPRLCKLVDSLSLSKLPAIPLGGASSLDSVSKSPSTHPSARGAGAIATMPVSDVASASSIRPVHLPDLNWSVLKAELAAGMSSRKCVILQALRFKLSRAESRT